MFVRSGAMWVAQALVAGAWLGAFGLGTLGAGALARADGFATLAARDAEGRAFELVALESDVAYSVGGLIGEATIHQRFTNRSAGYVEAEYLLPLPEGAAVHDLVLHVGGRTIVGEIHEKEKAREIYVAAAAQGKRAGLVESDRAQLFRTAVANVGPGETVEVEVRWQQRVTFRDGRFELVLPLTYTPRFVPTAPAMSEMDVALGHANDDDVHAVAAPTVSVHVDLDPGLPMARVESPSHALAIDRERDAYRIDLAAGAVPADRDFVLQWTPTASAVPRSALLTEQRDGETYAMLMVMPEDSVAVPLPRELILVIDTSGSMEGGSLQQAKNALNLALDSLRATDRFNVIEFNSVTHVLFETSVGADAAHLDAARAWIARLRATGGTEMADALRHALAGTAPSGYLRQVVFATDGAVDDVPGLYALIESSLGSARLFPIGIGSAPNAHFIERAATLGRGSAVVIRRLEDVGDRMKDLFAKLDSPALRDLALTWPDVAETYPARLPDLYVGEPVMVLARLARANGLVAVTGERSGAPWATKVPLARGASTAGIARAWAQRKVEALEQSIERGADADATKAAVVDLALEHHLVTTYTSLVAVDHTPVVPADADVASVRVPNGVPAGSLGFAKTASSAPLELACGALLLVLALALHLGARVRRLAAR